MTVRIPLVYDGNGEIEQLQSGDSLSTTSQLPQYTNGSGGAITIGSPVYISSNDTVQLAQANASGTVGVIGLVAQTSIPSSSVGSVQVEGVLTATTAQWDAIVGGSTGLTAGAKYYLSPTTAGLLTTTPTTTIGQYVIRVGRAISTTEMKIDIGCQILL